MYWARHENLFNQKRRYKKEMGINRWENLKYNPQKYAIPFGGRFNNNNIDLDQTILYHI